MSSTPATWSEAAQVAPGAIRWGPLVIGTDVDDAAIDILREHMPEYLEALVAQRELEFELEPPRQYDTILVGEELLDNILPCCVVETTRLETVQGGVARTYMGQWRTDVHVVVRGKRSSHTRRLAALYEGAVRRLMVQRAHEHPINWIHYVGMRFELIPGDARRGRYLLGAVAQFDIRTDEIVDPTGGRPEWPAETVRVDVRKERPPWPPS